jgi:hypothetical protein
MKTIQTPDRTSAATPATAGHEPDVQRPQLPPLEEQQQAASRGHRLESLPLGAPGDQYEQEADQTAAQVIARLESGSGPNTPVQATPTPGPAVQAKGESSGAGGSAAGATPAYLPPTPGSGQPLEPTVRRPMERAFGVDLSSVRLHTGRPAQQLNHWLDARATTAGRDIYFNQGEYDPGSASGRKLLAHELTHVLQQRRSAVRLQRARKGKEKTRPTIAPDPGDPREEQMQAGPPEISPPAPGLEDALQQRRAAAGAPSQYDSVDSPLDGGSETIPAGQYGQLQLAPPSPVYSNFSPAAAQAAGQGAVPAPAEVGQYGQLQLAPPAPVYSNFSPEAAQAIGQGVASAEDENATPPVRPGETASSASGGGEYAAPPRRPRTTAAGQYVSPPQRPAEAEEPIYSAPPQRPNNAGPTHSQQPNYAGADTMRRWRAEGARRIKRDERRNRR